MTKRIHIIAACSTNKIIGSNNKLLWKQSADMKRFRELTSGCCVIMGRKTFESIGGKPLPNRQNIVITHNPSSVVSDSVSVVPSLHDAIAIASTEDVWIIGGGQIYAEAINVVDDLYITHVHTIIGGDAIFPDISDDVWERVSTEDYGKDDTNEYDYSFDYYVRKK